MVKKLEKANSQSWKLKPMPKQKTRLLMERNFTAKQFDRMSYGFIPGQMEDKWFIYMETNILNFHRSWTGHFIYRVHLIPEGPKYSVSSVDVNRSKKLGGEEDDDYDLKIVNWLIDFFLLGKKAEYPTSAPVPLDYEIIDDD